jgi:hypothetical protein
MRCSDGHFYVVKFLNNPQHRRVLANEMLATRLAELVGLPVPATAVVEVGEGLVKHTPEMHIQLMHNVIPCQPGLQFGSRYVVNPLEGQVFDYLPLKMLDRVRNLETFAGMLVFDKWTGNADGRQAAFWRRSHERKYTAAFIDHGHCFNAGDWTLRDDPLHGVYARNEVYQTVAGWRSFDPWLPAIEDFPEHLVWEVVEGVPPEWYGDDWHAIEQLMTNLLERRRSVRGLIGDFRHSVTNPFPHWRDAA